jgi:hypothetical protein
MRPAIDDRAQLVCRFDAFGDDVGTELHAQSNHVPHQDLLPSALVQAGDEGAI